ncbi:MAG: hypothetical protein H6R26_2029 [Proteobacteria bacterium]|jgi:hypothetical protein|nr:hypothetical protein [Pseudomonadota bacterium]
MKPNPRFEPTVASVLLAIPSSLRSSAAAQAERYAALNVATQSVIRCNPHASLLMVTREWWGEKGRRGQ